MDIQALADNRPGLPGGLLRCAMAHPNDSEAAIAEFRSLAPLPDEAQRVIDQTTVQVGNDRLRLVQRLLDLGLTYSLPGWLGVPELYWEKEAKRGHAQRTMNPGSEGERSMPDRSGTRLPIYATQQAFSAGVRYLLAAERSGAPFDTSSVAQAIRRVNEAVEDACINGSGVTVTGNSAPGFLDEGNINTYQYLGGATGRAWDDASKTGAHIITDLFDMIGVLEGDNYYGPYELVVGPDYNLKLDEDYGTQYAKTIRMRILEIEQIQGITVADRMPSATDKTILFQTTSDVVDVVVGQQPVVISWESLNGFERFWLVLACMVPRIKADYDGNSGIVVGNTS